MSSFTKNIPQPADFLSTSQGQLLDNNISLVDAINIDHVSIETGTAGERMKHNIIHSKTQPFADPQPTTLADEGAVYAKLDGTGQDDLYYRHKSDGTVVKLTSGGGSGGNVLAYGRITITGVPTPSYSLDYGSNISAVANVATDLQITFTIPLTSANYVVFTNTAEQNILRHIQWTVRFGSETINNFRLVLDIISAPGYTSGDKIYVTVIG